MDNEKRDAKLDQLKGKVKEETGKLTGDKRTEYEGKTEKTSGKVKEFFEDAKDSVEGVIDGAKKPKVDDHHNRDRHDRREL